MRSHLLGLILLAGSASPALAQGQPWVQPEQPAGFGGVPAPGAVANLQARLDALERQIARLTGQNEESANRIRQLEAQLEAGRKQSDERLARIEAAAAAAPPVLAKAEAVEIAPGTAPVVIDKTVTVADAKPATTGDAGEDAYVVGFRQWEDKAFGEAQKSLEAMAKKYPKHARASYAMNLAGRAYLDDGKPATAAKVLLANYQANPKGDRAADSLYFLGQALMQLNKPAEACRVYDELTAVYPKMRDWVKERLPAARQEAKCGS